MMIIDFRVRPPAKGFEKLSLFGKRKAFETYPFNTPDTWPVPSATHHSMPLFMQEMDEAGIDKGIIMARNTATTLTPPVYGEEPWGSVANEEVAEVAAQYPDRLLAFGTVDPSCGIAQSLQDVDHAVLNLRCRGIVLEPGFCTPPLMPDAAKLYPLYQRCSELKVPVAITQSFEGGPHIRFARPDAIQTVANDFPSLQLIIVHSAYPFILEAVAIACYTPNIWLLPNLYMNVSAIPGRDLFAQALQFLHGRRVLFGSGYPYRSLAQSVEAVRKYQLPSVFYERLMYANAMELLNI